MSYTPFARWRNFTLANLKSVLELYPDLLEKTSREIVADQIEEKFPGYKRTAYQFGCQLGIESRASHFASQNYLHFLDDEGLEKYLGFWFKMYVCPNPYVHSEDEPCSPFAEIARRVLSSPSHRVSFSEFCVETFGEGGSLDIFRNALKLWGNPLVVDGDTISIASDKLEELKRCLEKVEATLPMTDNKDVDEFFSRFSCERFMSFYDLASIDDYSNGRKNSSQATPETVVPNADGLPRNLIYFGAPGTGKSYQLNKAAKASFLDKNVMRVTFHPDYSYSQFVGCFRPYSNKSGIGYRYEAGPFLQVYANACLHPNDQYLLIIEEINRANTAAVFGDVFQLLDRKKDGSSQYPIYVPDDMREALERLRKELSPDENKLLDAPKDYLDTLSLPPNMFIWATMNSADQGVYPMDSAFKRRWDFKYIGINQYESVIESVLVSLEDGREISWNEFRKGINSLLVSKNVNEDKLLGPFFIDANECSQQGTFVDVFENKVLLYLYEDAAKTKHRDVFTHGTYTYSQVCLDFERHGEKVFQDISLPAVGGVDIPVEFEDE